MLDKDGIVQVSSLIAPEDFYDGKNANVYAAMLELFLKNRPIDILTVREVLDDKKKLEEV